MFLSSSKSKIKDSLLFICINQKARNGKIVRTWTRNKFSVDLTLIGEIKFAEAIREIFKNQLFQVNYTVKEIERQVEDIISRTLQLPKLQRENGIRTEIVTLFALLSRQIKDYYFLIPISNLKINRKFRIHGKIGYFLNKYC